MILTVGLSVTIDNPDLGQFTIVNASTSEEGGHWIRQSNVAVLVLGDRLTPHEAHQLIASCEPHAGRSSVNIVVAAGPHFDVFQEFVDGDRVFYLSRRALQARTLEALTRAAAKQFLTQSASDREPLNFDFGTTELVVDFAVQSALQADLSAVAHLTHDSVETLLLAHHSECLLYDPDDDTLRSLTANGSPDGSRSASTGLIGYVARTGVGIALDQASMDPRFDPEVEGSAGSLPARFIAEPIVGAEGAILGVLTATRGEEAAVFSRADVYILKTFAVSLGSVFARALWQQRWQQSVIERLHGPLADGVYRREALEEHARIREPHVNTVRALAPWVMRTYWTILALLVAGLLWTLFAFRNRPY